MALGKYMKIVWMDLIGVGFISTGLYMIIFLTDQMAMYAPMGFALMVLGLFFSTIGGFYGKKKLLEGYREQLPQIESKQIDQLKQNVVSQLNPPEIPADTQKAVNAPRPDVKPPTQVKPQPEIQQRAQPAPAVTEGVVRILMCPGCDTENPPSNMFCFNCGKRLRAPAKKAAAKSKRKAG